MAQVRMLVLMEQPIDATTDAMEKYVGTVVEPFLRELEGNHDLRVALHFGGHLLDYISQHKPDVIMNFKSVFRLGQIEAMGGLFYGGIPRLLPEDDVFGQIRMANEYWEGFVGTPPRGFWVSPLAWGVDAPRIFGDSDLDYGLICSSCFEGETSGGAAVLERNGHRLPVFVVDDDASDKVKAGHVVQLSDMPGTVTVAWTLDEETSGIVSGLSEMATKDPSFFVLPSTSFDAAADQLPFGLVRETSLGAPVPGPVEDYYRDVLAASERLRDAVSTMEEESREDELSSPLATAQRHIFSAEDGAIFAPGAKGALCSAGAARLREAQALVDRAL